MSSELYYQVQDMLQKHITPQKKEELYEYFEKELKPILKKNDYKETYNPNNDTKTLIISPVNLTNDQFADILGILTY